MGFLNHVRLKYLVLLPIVFLLFNAMYFRYQTQEIQNTMLRQKLLEVTDAVDMLSAIVSSEHAELCTDCETCEHCDIGRASILEGVKFIDGLHYVYSAAFTQENTGLVLASARNNQTDFDPLTYHEFLSAVFKADQGNMVINVTPSGEDSRDLHIYFRWISSHSGQRYLVVAGVSKYSIVTKIPLQVSIVQWVAIVVTFLFDTACTLLLVYLGHIYVQRQGPTKWRCRRPQ